MKNRKYFEPFPMLVTVGFIVLIAILWLSTIAKKVLEYTGLLDSNDFKNQAEAGSDQNAIIGLIIIGGFLYSAICFYRFMRIANQGQIFSNLSSKIWKNMSIIYLVLVVITTISVIFDLKFLVLSFACGFVSSICFSFSRIFADSGKLKQENDLTI